MSFRIDKTPPVIQGIVESGFYSESVKIYFNEGRGRINNKVISNHFHKDHLDKNQLIEFEMLNYHIVFKKFIR